VLGHYSGMRLPALLSAVLCVACADLSIPLPVRIEVDPELGAQEFQLWQQAADDWNDAVPGIVEIVTTEHLARACGVVLVSRRSSAAERSANTHMDGEGCVADTTIKKFEDFPSSAYYVAIARHELAHIFLASSEEVNTWGEEKIPADVVERVRARLR
jgi:hypothetical protein